MVRSWGGSEVVVVRAKGDTGVDVRRQSDVSLSQAWNNPVK